MQAKSTCDGLALEDADEPGARLCTRWASFFRAREGNYEDGSCETILNSVQKAPC